LQAGMGDRFWFLEKNRIRFRFAHLCSLIL
jgi:hypothetical protein